MDSTIQYTSDERASLEQLDKEEKSLMGIKHLQPLQTYDRNMNRIRQNREDIVNAAMKRMQANEKPE